MSVTTKAWLHALGAAAIGSAASAVPLCIVSPTTFNASAAGIENLLKVCALSALVAVAAMLKQSPLPGDDQK